MKNRFNSAWFNYNRRAATIAAQLRNIPRTSERFNESVQLFQANRKIQSFLEKYAFDPTFTTI